MRSLVLSRLGAMVALTFCVTIVVFFMTNLRPSLEKLARSESNNRMTNAQVSEWLEARG